MYKLAQIISHTPVWVWGVLGYLLIVGIKATLPQTIFLPKIFIIPLVMLALKTNILFTQSGWVFLGVISIATMISFWLHQHTKIVAIKPKLLITIPGTYITLIILMAFFIERYVFSYWQHALPELANQYQLCDIIISGIFFGYVFGKAIRYAYRYYQS